MTNQVTWYSQPGKDAYDGSRKGGTHYVTDALVRECDRKGVQKTSCVPGRIATMRGNMSLDGSKEECLQLELEGFVYRNEPAREGYCKIYGKDARTWMLRHVYPEKTVRNPRYTVWWCVRSGAAPVGGVYTRVDSDGWQMNRGKNCYPAHKSSAVWLDGPKEEAQAKRRGRLSIEAAKTLCKENVHRGCKAFTISEDGLVWLLRDVYPDKGKTDLKYDLYVAPVDGSGSDVQPPPAKRRR